MDPNARVPVRLDGQGAQPPAIGEIPVDLPRGSGEARHSGAVPLGLLPPSHVGLRACRRRTRVRRRLPEGTACAPRAAAATHRSRAAYAAAPRPSSATFGPGRSARPATGFCAPARGNCGCTVPVHRAARGATPEVVPQGRAGPAGRLPGVRIRPGGPLAEVLIMGRQASSVVSAGWLSGFRVVECAAPPGRGLWVSWGRQLAHVRTSSVRFERVPGMGGGHVPYPCHWCHSCPGRTSADRRPDRAGLAGSEPGGMSDSVLW